MERKTGKRWQNGAVPEDLKDYRDACREAFQKESNLEIPEEINFFYNDSLRTGDGYFWYTEDPSVNHVLCVAGRLKDELEKKARVFVHELAHMAQCIVRFATTQEIETHLVYARKNTPGHGEDFERWEKLFLAACGFDK